MECGKNIILRLFTTVTKRYFHQPLTMVMWVLASLVRIEVANNRVCIISHIRFLPKPHHPSAFVYICKSQFLFVVRSQLHNYISRYIHFKNGFLILGLDFFFCQASEWKKNHEKSMSKFELAPSRQIWNLVPVLEFVPGWKRFSFEPYTTTFVFEIDSEVNTQSTRTSSWTERHYGRRFVFFASWNNVRIMTKM